MKQYDLIFDKDGTGADELHELIGMIDADIDFYKWKRWLKLSKRQVTSVVGNDVFQAAAEFYFTGKINEQLKEDPVEIYKSFVEKVQTCTALFAWLKIIPTLDAQHGKSGRQKRTGENERGLTAVEQYKDEANIQSLAYESLDDLLAYLEENKDEFLFWTGSDVYKDIKNLIIQDLDTFNSFYKIDSFRLFVTIRPWIKEVQDVDVVPLLTPKRFEDFKTALDKKEADRTDYEKKLAGMKNLIYRPTVLLAMIKAFKRLPVQAIPEGLVQVQIIGTVKERLRATQEAINALVSGLTNDANKAINTLETEIGDLNGLDPYVSYARKIGHGFTF